LTQSFKKIKCQFTGKSAIHMADFSFTKTEKPFKPFQPFAIKAKQIAQHCSTKHIIYGL